MYGYGLGEAFLIAAEIELRTKDAREALLQPGISVRNLEPVTGKYGVVLANLEVTAPDKTSRIVTATPYEIEAIMNNDAFPKGFSSVRTVLCQAMSKAKDLDQANETRRAENSRKSWFRHFF